MNKNVSPNFFNLLPYNNAQCCRCSIAGTGDRVSQRELYSAPPPEELDWTSLEVPTSWGGKDRGGNGKRWGRRKRTGGRFPTMNSWLRVSTPMHSVQKLCAYSLMSCDFLVRLVVFNRLSKFARQSPKEIVPARVWPCLVMWTYSEVCLFLYIIAFFRYRRVRCQWQSWFAVLTGIFSRPYLVR